MRRVLVTGGTGFMESHVADKLLADGWHATAVGNFDPFYDRAMKLANLRHNLGHPRFRFRMIARHANGPRDLLKI